MVPRAHFGPIPIDRVEISIDEPRFRWMREHGTLHIPDVARAERFSDVGFSRWLAHLLGRSPSSAGELIGALTARRTEVRPFTPAQIKLLETFADQAVIAIENVRLFQELKESLEQQTATSEILGVIASSPTDIQPVLDVVAENAARLCDANDALIPRVDGERPSTGGSLWTCPTVRVLSMPIDRGSSTGRAIIDRQTIHIHDLAAELEPSFRSAMRYSESGVRTCLPRRCCARGSDRGDYDSPHGGPSVHRQADRSAQNLRRPSGDRHRERPAVQGIQERNAELREALEHQTATSEVLGIISRSPTDVQPVLDAIVESAARVCGIDDVVLRLREGNTMVPRAHFGPIPIQPRRDQY